MSKDVSFQLDPSGGEDILQRMVEPTIRKSAEAIAARATSMAASQTSNPPEITVTHEIGIIRRGVRAIATVLAKGNTKHAQYIGRLALTKAKDAGRVS